MDRERALAIYFSTLDHVSAGHLHRYFKGDTSVESRSRHPEVIDSVIKGKNYHGAALRILDLCESLGVSVSTFLDQEYPEKLRGIDIAPPVLYFRGDRSLLDGFTGSIVGSRKPTHTGMIFCERLSRTLSMKGVTILSGFARGIDSCAHRGALKGNGKTVAVFGSGVDVIYPRENERLYHVIVESGCVLSRYPPGTPPLRKNFPVRNSMIAALSDFVCVIEAARKSGSLITARYGLEFGKEIFSVPGSPLFPQSEGTNELIKHGAHPLTCPSDIYEAFGLSFPKPVRKAEKSDEGLSPLEKKVLHAIRGEMSLDEISLSLRLDVREVSPILVALEMKNLVVRGGSGYFCRLEYGR